MPWVSTHHHQTRCFAHLVLHSLVAAYPALFFSSEAANSYASVLMKQMMAFTAQNPAAQRLLEACPLSLHTDFAMLSHPRCLLQGQNVLVGSCEADPVECAPLGVIGQFAAFLEAERKRLRQQQSSAAPESQQHCHTPAFMTNSSGAHNQVATADSVGVSDCSGRQGGPGQGYQRKVEPWRAVGAAQAHSEHAHMEQDAVLLRLMGYALDF
jgi:hypothetical protein